MTLLNIEWIFIQKEAAHDERYSLPLRRLLITVIASAMYTYNNICLTKVTDFLLLSS